MFSVGSGKSTPVSDYISNHKCTLLLPLLPPSTNSLHRVSRTGHLYVTDKYRDFKESVKVSVLNQLPEGFELLKDNIRLIIEFTVADKRRHDIDNMLKSLFDSLNGVLWVDDNGVIEIHVSKTIGQSPKTEITYY